MVLTRAVEKKPQLQFVEKWLRFLAHHEKRAVSRLLAHLCAFDERQLAMKKKGRSLFDYCAKDLGFEEFDAYRRIRGARVAHKYPAVLDLVEQGKLNLTSLVVLHPVLTIIGTQLHKTDFEGHNWGIALVIGLTFYLIRRVRS